MQKERDALRNQRYLELLDERKFALPDQCLRPILKKNIISQFESGYFLAVNPNPTCLDILCLIYPERYYGEESKDHLPFQQKEEKFKEQMINY